MSATQAPFVNAVLVLSLSRSDSINAILEEPAALAVQSRILDRLCHNLREEDRVCLIGHDEIWILLQRLPSDAVATLAANRLAAEMETPVFVKGAVATVRSCIGVAVAHGDDLTAQDILHAASQARNRARVLHLPFSVATAEDYGLRMNADLVQAVEYALQHNVLRLAYQPKVDLGERTVTGVEALVRWPRSLQPALSPATLIQVAEEYGLIKPLTRFVLHTALREFCNQLRPVGIDRIWVNISARLLTDPELMPLLTQLVELWNVPPSVLGLEITESMLITDIEQSVAVLNRLANHGFALAVDDFGTGYSSLAYLRRLPVDELKIDKVFVRDLPESKDDVQIVRAIISLAHQFDLQVVAEGVEDDETLSLLAKMGCDQVQGYVFAKGMSAEETVAWCQDFRKPVRRSLPEPCWLLTPALPA